MLYETPALTEALRIFSAWFVIHAAESMSFTLAIRRQNARIVSYCELVTTVASSVFVIAYSFFHRDWHGMIYGMLVNRALMAGASYLFYRSERAGLQFDRSALKASMGFAKYTLPSSLLTLLISQFDKFIFLRLFDIHLLGLYGLAGNIAGPIDGLIVRISRSVLFPRCATNHRRDPTTVGLRYYRDNVKLIMFTLFLPAALAGAATPLVHVLFDHRYAYASVILAAFAMRGMIAALTHPAENLLVATGTPRPIVFANMLRVAWLVPGSLLGYHFGGFEGFLYVAALHSLPVVVLYFWLQYRRGLLIVRYEAAKVCYMGLVFLLTLGLSYAVLPYIGPIQLKGS
jgi:O-antigen/teichoic acid export membrane protein